MDRKKIGQYVLLDRLGSLRNNVYHARHCRNQIEVALKIEHVENAFVFEEAALTHLPQHPNLVQLYDTLPHESGIATLYVTGQNLRDHLKRKQKLSSAESLEIFGGLLEGLEVAHDRGVWHRDVKPANIIISDSRTPVLIDFGAAYHRSIGHLDDKERIRGTPAYISPEVIAQQQSEKQDVYSSGITLYEMLIGGIPFRGRTIEQVLYKHQWHKISAPSDINPDIPTDVSDLVIAATSKKPATRPSVAELIQKVGRLKSRYPTSPRRRRIMTR